MMKTLSSILMGIAIFAGLVLAITPFIADKFFPVPENATRIAKPDAAIMALQQWFQSPDALITDVQAINKSNSEGSSSWFSFSVGRRPIEKYIIKTKLTQKTLSTDVLKTTFFSENPPASWWHPSAVNQKTYFSGTDQGRSVALIYNPGTKRGVLVTTTKIPD